MGEQAGRPEQGDAPRAPEGERPAASTRTIWIDLLVYPTHSIPTAVAPVIIGCGLAIRDGVFSPWPALVGFLGSWAIHVAGVFTDNHELLRRHPAVIEHPELNHALAEGTLRLSTLRLAILGCLALACAAAPYLHHIGGGPVLALGVLGIAVSLSYAGGPWAYVRRGHADPIFFVMFGVVAEAATYYIQVAAVRGALRPWRTLLDLPPAVFLAGLSCGALVTSVMLIDDIRDAGFDAEKGWRTGAVRFGTAFTRAEITALVAFAYAWPFVAWLGLGLDAWVLLPLVSAPLAWSTVRTVRTESVRERLHPLTPAMARLAVIHSVLLSVGIALSR
jgi:1,4-dihydroxy-2-naphthoate octaprenyltransferase